MNPQLLPKVRSKGLTSSCEGMTCTLRIASLVPGHRCAPDSTVVGVHLDGMAPHLLKGMSTKESDLFLVAGCQHCHDLLARVDHRYQYLEERAGAAVLQRVILAMKETQSQWIGSGLLIVPDGEVI